MADLTTLSLIAILAFSVSAGLTEVLRRLCTRCRVLDQPNRERWHRSPRPRLGGVAIFAALLGSVPLFVEHPIPRVVYGLLAGAGFAFAWGLIDDLRPLRTLAKSVLLIASGVIPLFFGISFPGLGPVWGMIITAAWVTGITNAMNWLDNMDGVTAGVSAVSAGVLLALAVFTGHALGAVMAAALVGVSLGFLVHNFPPARMFMGDCGSGVLGYLLAVTTVVVVSGNVSSVPRPMVTALFVLGVPILDMMLVVAWRTLHERSIFAGGRDHLAHRLVTLGLSEREVVAVLYTLALASGAVAMLTFGGPGTTRPFAIGAGATLIMSLGVVGSLVNVYQRPSRLRACLVALRARWGATPLYGGLLVVGLALLYYPMMAALAAQWLTNLDYSHGPLIPVVSAYLIWQRWDRIKQCHPAPSAFGYLVIVVGVALYIVGEAAAVGYLMRISLIVVLAGLVLFLSGREALTVAAFPLAYLLFMIPPPYVVSDRITLPLQFLASNLATSALDVAGIPVFREGNIITLAAGQLAVTEACSGIRSLIALGAIGTIYGYLVFPDWWRRALIVVSTVPIAIVTNAARVTVTAVLADVFGLERAMSFYHAFSGLVIFVLAALLLVLVGATLSSIVPFGLRRRPHAHGV